MLSEKDQATVEKFSSAIQNLASRPGGQSEQRLWAEVCSVFWRFAHSQGRYTLCAHLGISAMQSLARDLLKYLSNEFARASSSGVKFEWLRSIVSLHNDGAFTLMGAFCNPKLCTAMIPEGKMLHGFVVNCVVREGGPLLWMTQAYCDFCDFCYHALKNGELMSTKVITAVKACLECLHSCCAERACATELINSEPLALITRLFYGIKLRSSRQSLLRPELVSNETLLDLSLAKPNEALCDGSPFNAPQPTFFGASAPVAFELFASPLPVPRAPAPELPSHLAKPVFVPNEIDDVHDAALHIVVLSLTKSREYDNVAVIPTICNFVSVNARGARPGLQFDQSVAILDNIVRLLRTLRDVINECAPPERAVVITEMIKAEVVEQARKTIEGLSDLVETDGSILDVLKDLMLSGTDEKNSTSASCSVTDVVLPSTRDSSPPNLTHHASFSVASTGRKVADKARMMLGASLDVSLPHALQMGFTPRIDEKLCSVSVASDVQHNDDTPQNAALYELHKHVANLFASVVYNETMSPIIRNKACQVILRYVMKSKRTFDELFPGGQILMPPTEVPAISFFVGIVPTIENDEFSNPSLRAHERSFRLSLLQVIHTLFEVLHMFPSPEDVITLAKLAIHPSSNVALSINQSVAADAAGMACQQEPIVLQHHLEVLLAGVKAYGPFSEIDDQLQAAVEMLLVRLSTDSWLALQANNDECPEHQCLDNLAQLFQIVVNRMNTEKPNLKLVKTALLLLEKHDDAVIGPFALRLLSILFASNILSAYRLYIEAFGTPHLTPIILPPLFRILLRSPPVPQSSDRSQCDEYYQWVEGREQFIAEGGLDVAEEIACDVLSTGEDMSLLGQIFQLLSVFVIAKVEEQGTIGGLDSQLPPSVPSSSAASPSRVNVDASEAVPKIGQALVSAADAEEAQVALAQCIIDAATNNYYDDVHVASSQKYSQRGPFSLREPNCAAEKPFFLDMIPLLIDNMIARQRFVLASSLTEALMLIAEATGQVRSSSLLSWARSNNPKLLSYLYLPLAEIQSFPYNDNVKEMLDFWGPLLAQAPRRSELRFHSSGGVTISVPEWPKEGLTISAWLKFHEVYPVTSLFEFTGMTLEGSAFNDSLVVEKGESVVLQQNAALAGQTAAGASSRRRILNEDKPLEGFEAKKWLHFSVVLSSSKSTSVFFHGQLVGATESTVGSPSCNLIHIGFVKRGRDQAVFSVGDIQVWREPLTAPQILAEYCESDPNNRFAPKILPTDVPRELSPNGVVSSVPVATRIARFVPHCTTGHLGTHLVNLVKENVTADIQERRIAPPSTFVNFHSLFLSRGGLRYIVQWIESAMKPSDLDFALKLFAETVRYVNMTETMRPRVYALAAYFLKTKSSRKMITIDGCRSLLRLATVMVTTNGMTAVIIVNRMAMEHLLMDIETITKMPHEVAIFYLQELAKLFDVTTNKQFAKRNAEFILGQRVFERALHSLARISPQIDNLRRIGVMELLRKLYQSLDFSKEVTQSIIAVTASLCPQVQTVDKGGEWISIPLEPHISSSHSTQSSERRFIPLRTTHFLTSRLLHMVFEALKASPVNMHQQLAQLINLPWFLTVCSRFSNSSCVAFASRLLVEAANANAELAVEVASNAHVVASALFPHALNQDIVSLLLASAVGHQDKINYFDVTRSSVKQLDDVLESCKMEPNRFVAPIFAAVLEEHIRMTMSIPLCFRPKQTFLKDSGSTIRLSWRVRRFFSLVGVVARLLLPINIARSSKRKEPLPMEQQEANFTQEEIDCSYLPFFGVPSKRILDLRRLRIHNIMSQGRYENNAHLPRRFRRAMTILRPFVLLIIGLYRRRYKAYRNYQSLKGSSLLLQKEESDDETTHFVLMIAKRLAAQPPMYPYLAQGPLQTSMLAAFAGFLPTGPEALCTIEKEISKRASVLSDDANYFIENGKERATEQSNAEPIEGASLTADTLKSAEGTMATFSPELSTDGVKVESHVDPLEEDSDSDEDDKNQEGPTESEPSSALEADSHQIVANTKPFAARTTEKKAAVSLTATEVLRALILTSLRIQPAAPQTSSAPGQLVDIVAGVLGASSAVAIDLKLSQCYGSTGALAFQLHTLLLSSVDSRFVIAFFCRTIAVTFGQEGEGMTETMVNNILLFVKFLTDRVTLNITPLELVLPFLREVLYVAQRWSSEHLNSLRDSVAKICVAVFNRDNPSSRDAEKARDAALLDNLESVTELLIAVLRRDWDCGARLEELIFSAYKVWKSTPPTAFSAPQTRRMDLLVAQFFRTIVNCYRGTQRLKKALSIRSITQTEDLHHEFEETMMKPLVDSARALGQMMELHTGAVDAIMRGRPRKKVDEFLKRKRAIHTEFRTNMIAVINDKKLHREEASQHAQVLSKSYFASLSSYVTEGLPVIDPQSIHWLYFINAIHNEKPGSEGVVNPLVGKKRHYYDSMRNYVPFYPLRTIDECDHKNAAHASSVASVMDASVCEEQVALLSMYLPNYVGRCSPLPKEIGSKLLVPECTTRLTDSAKSLLRFFLAPGERVRHICNGFRVQGIHATSCLIVLTESMLKIFGSTRLTSQGDIVVGPQQEQDAAAEGETPADVSNSPSASQKTSELVKKKVRSVTMIVQNKLRMFDGAYETKLEASRQREDGSKVAKSVHASHHETDVSKGLCWFYYLNNVLRIQKVHYLHQDAAIHISLSHDDNPLLAVVDESLSMNSNARDTLVREITALIGNQIDVIDETKKRATLADVTNTWVHRSCSNYEYLMFLNRIASRIKKDWNQYPVLPWVLKDYCRLEVDLTDPSIFRDFSFPIGAQLEEKRAALKERYDSLCDGSGGDDGGGSYAFHHGTHYSSSGGVLYFLIRAEPYTTRAKIFQGGEFDHADRLFASIEATFRNCFEGGDCKELVPEFFMSSSFLQNRDHLDFGVKQDGTIVDNVILPQWAKGSYQIFTTVMRLALESEYVTSCLHQWIDLIFGPKQRGKSAAQCYNKFQRFTYGDEVLAALKAAKTEHECRQIIAEVENFGQTPVQLFAEPHPAVKEISQSGVLQGNKDERGPEKEKHHVQFNVAKKIINYALRLREETRVPDASQVDGASQQFAFTLREASSAVIMHPPQMLIDTYTPAADPKVRSFDQTCDGAWFANVPRVSIIPTTELCICWNEFEKRLMRFDARTGKFVSLVQFELPEGTPDMHITALHISRREILTFVGTSAGTIYCLHPDSARTWVVLGMTLCCHAYPIQSITVNERLSRLVSTTSSSKDFPIVWRVQRLFISKLHALPMDKAFPETERVPTGISICSRNGTVFVATCRCLAVFDGEGQWCGTGQLPSPGDADSVSFKKYADMSTVTHFSTYEWCEATVLVLTGHSDSTLSLWSCKYLAPEDLIPGGPTMQVKFLHVVGAAPTSSNEMMRGVTAIKQTADAVPHFLVGYADGTVLELLFEELVRAVRHPNAEEHKQST